MVRLTQALTYPSAPTHSWYTDKHTRKVHSKSQLVWTGKKATNKRTSTHDEPYLIKGAVLHDTRTVVVAEFCVRWYWQLFRRSKKLLLLSLFFLNEDCFNLNYSYKVYPKVDKMRVTIMFFITSLWLIKRNYVIFDFTQCSVWRRSNCNIFSLDLLKTYTIFLHRDRQLPWRF